jgi:hypothetical protein
VDVLCTRVNAGEKFPLFSHIKYLRANEKLLNVLNTYGPQVNPIDYLKNCALYIRFE